MNPDRMNPDRMNPRPASALRDRLLQPETCARVAARWSRSLGLPVRFELARFPVVIAGGEPIRAIAHLTGRVDSCRLHVQTQLLAGQVQALAGLAARPLGPVPLSEAEAGLFAWLVLDALPALAPGAALSPSAPGASAPDTDSLYLAGTTRGTRAPAGQGVTWLADIGDRSGLVHWEFAAAGPAASGRARAVPIPTRLTAGLPGSLHALVPGAARDVASLCWQWTAADTPLFPVTLRLEGEPSALVFRVTGDEPAASPMEISMPLDPADLPCALTLDLGTVVLSAGAIADLRPGTRIPLQLGERPRVWLRAGDVLVAEAELIDLTGQPAVRITRTLLPGAD